MNTLEEVGQPFGNKQHFREASYNDLPPEVKNLVDKALDSMEMGIFPGNVQMFALDRPLTFWTTISLRQNYWACWEYSAEECRQFDRLDWGRAIRRFIRFVATWVGLCMVLFHESEAEQLVKRFRTETIPANKKSYVPPEPQ